MRDDEIPECIERVLAPSALLFCVISRILIPFLLRPSAGLCKEAEAKAKAAAAEAADARAMREEALAHARLCEERALEAVRFGGGASAQQRGGGGAAAGFSAMLREADAAAAAAEADSRERERRIMELIHPAGSSGGGLQQPVVSAVR